MTYDRLCIVVLANTIYFLIWNKNENMTFFVETWNENENRSSCSSVCVVEKDSENTIVSDSLTTICYIQRHMSKSANEKHYRK